MAVNIPTHPAKLQSSLYGPAPWVWWGTSAVDGDAGDWVDAPVGSMYIYNNGGTAAAMYIKTAANDADADWADTTD